MNAMCAKVFYIERNTEAEELIIAPILFTNFLQKIRLNTSNKPKGIQFWILHVNEPPGDTKLTSI